MTKKTKTLCDLIDDEMINKDFRIDRETKEAKLMKRLKPRDLDDLLEVFCQTAECTGQEWAVEEESVEEIFDYYRDDAFKNYVTPWIGVNKLDTKRADACGEAASRIVDALEAITKLPNARFAMWVLLAGLRQRNRFRRGAV